jgi:hypothetical protein
MATVLLPAHGGRQRRQDKFVALEIGNQCYLGDEDQILLQARMLYPPMAG